MFLYYLIKIWNKEQIKEHAIPPCRAGPLVRVHMENFRLTLVGFRQNQVRSHLGGLAHSHMNTLHFYRSFLRKVRSHLGKPACLTGPAHLFLSTLLKSSTLPLMKVSFIQSVALWHTNFTLSCVILLWDSATTHSPSGKELIFSSLEESCFSGLIVW